MIRAPSAGKPVVLASGSECSWSAGKDPGLALGARKNPRRLCHAPRRDRRRCVYLRHYLALYKLHFMRRSREQRGFLKCVGVAACALLICGWIGTFWSSFGYQVSTVSVYLWGGCFMTSIHPEGWPTQGWFATWMPYEAFGLPMLTHGGYGGARVCEPRIFSYPFGFRSLSSDQRRSYCGGATADIHRAIARNVATTSRETLRASVRSAASRSQCESRTTPHATISGTGTVHLVAPAQAPELAA